MIRDENGKMSWKFTAAPVAGAHDYVRITVTAGDSFREDYDSWVTPLIVEIEGHVINANTSHGLSSGRYFGCDMTDSEIMHAYYTSAIYSIAVAARGIGYSALEEWAEKTHTRACEVAAMFYRAWPAEDPDDYVDYECAHGMSTELCFSPLDHYGPDAAFSIGR